MEENKWRDLWGKCSGSIYQSWEWAEINKSKGKKPIFLSVESDGKLISGILCFEQMIKTPLGGKNVLFSEGTPLYLDESRLSEVLKKFKEESRKYFYGFVRPTFFSCDAEIFKKVGFYGAESNTMQISLSPLLGELFNGLEKKSARWGVKKAEKEGVKIDEGHLKGELKDFYNLYKSTSEGQFTSEPWSFFDNLEILERAKLAKLFIARHRGRVIGGSLMLLDDNYGVVYLTAVSDEGMKMQAMNVLYWEMIKYCKENKKKLIDLGGYSEGAKEGTKMNNINKFKENFGGQVVKQPQFSTSRKYSILFGLRKKFGFLKNLYKKEK